MEENKDLQKILQDSFSEMSTMAGKNKAQVELTVSQRDSFSATYQQRKLKSYNADDGLSASIRVIRSGSTGQSRTERLDSQALKEAFSEALKSAEDLSKGQSSPHDLEMISGSEEIKKMNLMEEDFRLIEVSKKLQWAEELEKSALEKDSRITNVPYSAYRDWVGTTWIMNSRGLQKSYQTSGLMAYAYPVAKENGLSSTGYRSVFTRKASGFKPNQVANEAVEKALELLPGKTAKSGRYPTVLVNDVASEIINFLADHFSAKTLDEKGSWFESKLGSTVFSKEISIWDDPFQNRLMGARPYDAEGASSQKTQLVENGKFLSFLTNYNLAKKLNLPHTASAVGSSGDLGAAPSNLIVSAGKETFEDLIKTYPKVFVVTKVSALHSGFKGLTGDFSLPAEGFIFENGKLMEVFNQTVLSGNLFDLLAKVEKVSSRQVDDGSSVVAPDLLIPELSFAGN